MLKYLKKKKKILGYFFGYGYGNFWVFGYGFGYGYGDFWGFGFVFW